MYVRCKAAVAWAPNEPLKVEEIEVAPPQKGEVRVKVIANALVRITAVGGCGRSCFVLP